jgi:hypothetical protein
LTGAVASGSSAADWLSAWGQIGGAVGTLLTLSVAIFLARRDSRWRRAEQADRDIAQARLLTVDADYAYTGSRPFEMIVIIANNSAQPMLDVNVEAVRSLQEPNLAWRFSSPNPEAATSANVLRPGAQLVVEVEFADDAGSVAYPDGADSVTVTYTDYNGLRWRRTDRCLPERILEG